MRTDNLFPVMRERLLRMLEERELSGDDQIREAISRLILSEPSGRFLTLDERLSLSRELFDSVRRLDILQELVDDKSVTEIMVNGPDTIFIEQCGKIRRYEKTFLSKEVLENLIREIAGRCNRVINETSPIVDARLADGSRVNAVIAPVALNGPILTIRQFPETPITIDTLVRSGSITRECVDFLSMLVAARYSIIISGGTSAGKTTFLNALSDRIPKGERIITIEDNAELQIQGVENLVRLEAKQANSEGLTAVTIRDLIKSALRMRPDRIIVGEVRSGEALDMVQALNTGHDGSMTSLHANSCADALSRIEMLCLMAADLPLPAVRRQIASGVDILTHLGRTKDGMRRVLEIAEVTGMSGDQIDVNPLYQWDVKERILKKCGNLKHTLKLEQAGFL